jgi:hypothetical protein
VRLFVGLGERGLSISDLAEGVRSRFGPDLSAQLRPDARASSWLSRCRETRAHRLCSTSIDGWPGYPSSRCLELARSAGSAVGTAQREPRLVATHTVAWSAAERPAENP